MELGEAAPVAATTRIVPRRTPRRSGIVLRAPVGVAFLLEVGKARVWVV
jgi:hypothetical protein